MQYSSIELDITGGVATVTMNRPSRLNALTRSMLEEMLDCFGQLSGRNDVRIAVLCGAGRAFAAGVDLQDLEVADDDLAHGDIGEAMNAPARKLIETIERAPFPVIAKVHGACFTGALEIALGCDFIVAANETKFGDTHAKLGIRPTWGMTARLREAVGIRRARELSYTSRTFTGAEAESFGMVTQAVPGDELDRTVDDLAQTILANSADSLKAYKELYREGTQHQRSTARELESKSRYAIADGAERVADFVEGLRKRQSKKS